MGEVLQFFGHYCGHGSTLVVVDGPVVELPRSSVAVTLTLTFPPTGNGPMWPDQVEPEGGHRGSSRSRGSGPPQDDRVEAGVVGRRGADLDGSAAGPHDEAPRTGARRSAASPGSGGR